MGGTELDPAFILIHEKDEQSVCAVATDGDSGQPQDQKCEGQLTCTIPR